MIWDSKLKDWIIKWIVKIIPFFIGKNYSTTEKWTGKYWTDGKKIYKKTVNAGTFLAQAGTRNVPHGISNIDFITDLKGTIQGGIGSVPLAWAIPESLAFATYVAVDKTNIKLTSGANRSDYRAMVTMYYTCTDR